jgi:hypothetical protein
LDFADSIYQTFSFSTITKPSTGQMEIKSDEIDYYNPVNALCMDAMAKDMLLFVFE